MQQAHFSAQHEAAAELGAVEITELDAFLRGILFTDGTVGRALEVQALGNLTVDCVEQVPGPAPAREARYLLLEQDEECIRRRIEMRLAGASLSVWAESFLVRGRLPAAFLARLERDPQGIGGSIQDLKLESRRELLWFGLGHPPAWAGELARDTATLTRVYRVFTADSPVMLISEAFAIEMHLGVYYLSGAARLDGDGARDSLSERLRPDGDGPRGPADGRLPAS